MILGSKGGAVVRALAFRQCGSGSNRGFNAIIMWVEFVVGSLPCSERFFSGYSAFPLSSKTNISKFQFDQELGRRRTIMCMCYLQIVIYLFYLFYLFTFSSKRARQQKQQCSTLTFIFMTIIIIYSIAKGM